MKPILISLSPNTQRDDVLAAARLLLTPWQWRNLATLTAARQALEAFFDLPVVLFSSGRAAIAAVLQARSIGEGDEVIVQAFTCVAVPAAVMWAKATPVYADIDPATYNLDVADVRAKITPRTKAIIIQHTFGIPAAIDEILRVAAEHNLFVIEDCAHAAGGRFNDKLLGTFGDAAIVSFGRDKTISTVFGGALLSRHPELIQALAQQQNALPLPPWWWVKQQLMHPLFFAVIKPLYFTAGIGKIILVVAQRIGLLSKAVQMEERSGGQPAHTAWRYSPALAVLLVRQLQKLPAYTARRQSIAAAYAHALKINIDHPASQPAWLRFPLRVDKPKLVVRAAKKKAILLGDWYDTPVVPAQDNYDRLQYVPGSCPEAEKAAKEVLNLPTYPTMRETEVARVITFITSQLHP